jgi:hypothetical protein
MATLKFLRCKHVIRTLSEDGNHTDEHFNCKRTSKPSISAAKRASRKLQMENGGLGMGSLQIVEKLA